MEVVTESDPPHICLLLLLAIGPTLPLLFPLPISAAVWFKYSPQAHAALRISSDNPHIVFGFEKD
jgi:hypothetical protein